MFYFPPVTLPTQPFFRKRPVYPDTTFGYFLHQYERGYTYNQVMIGSLMTSNFYDNDGNPLMWRVLLNCKQILMVKLLYTYQWHLRLVDFFRYFAREFPYGVGVASIRAGLLKKASKGWQNDVRSFGPSDKVLFS
jgi:hypothetical protein